MIFLQKNFKLHNFEAAVTKLHSYMYIWSRISKMSTDLCYNVYFVSYGPAKSLVLGLAKADKSIPITSDITGFTVNSPKFETDQRNRFLWPQLVFSLSKNFCYPMF